MRKSPLRDRGLTCVVDTTAAVELDFATCRRADRQIETLARRLAAAPFLPDDAELGPMIVRQLSGYDLAFVPSREPGLIVLTLWMVRPSLPGEPLEILLKVVSQFEI